MAVLFLQVLCAQVTGVYVNLKDKSERLTLREDGSFALVERGKNYAGTFRVTGNELVLRVPGPGADQQSRAKIEGIRIFDREGKVWEKVPQPAGSSLPPDARAVPPAALDEPPRPSMGQPYESYAWELVMWHVKRTWADAFQDSTACKGARITEILGVAYEQVRGFRPNARTELLPVSQVDRLNGIEFRARYHITAEASRLFESGRWSQWVQGFDDAMPHVEGPQVGYFVELKNGRWTAGLYGTNMTMRRSAFPCGQMPQ